MFCRLIIIALAGYFVVPGPLKAEVIYMDDEDSYDYAEQKPQKKKKVRKAPPKTKKPAYQEEEELAEEEEALPPTPKPALKPTQKPTPKAMRKPADSYGVSAEEYEEPLPKPKPSQQAVRKPVGYGETIEGEGGILTPPSRPAPRAKYKVPKEKNRRRVLGDHIFPTTVLFPSPIPSARFGFSQGVGTTNGKYIWISGSDIQRKKYSRYGFSEIFDAGMVFSNFAALDLNAKVQLDGGMDNKDFITVEARPNGDIRVGPVFYYKKENSKLLLSFSPRLYYSRGVSISAAYGIVGMLKALEQGLGNDPGFDDFFGNTASMGGDAERLDTIDEFFTLLSSTYVKNNLTDITSGFTKNIMVNTSALAISPSLGVAYPITPYLGFQGFFEYQKITQEAATKTESEKDKYSKFNFGGALSVDCRHFINFPLGIALEYSLESKKGEFGDLETRNNYGFGTYYQGIGDIQLGLFLKSTQSKYKFTGYDESYSQTLGMFNITYFF